MIMLSFTTDTSPQTKHLSGHVYHYPNGTAVDPNNLFMLSVDGQMRIIDIDSGGFFECDIEYWPESKIMLNPVGYAPVSLIFNTDADSLYIDSLYLVAFDSELKVTSMLDSVECDEVVYHFRGPSISNVLDQVSQKPCGMIPNPIDTIKLGEGDSSNNGPSCRYEYKLLSFTKSL